MEMPRLRPVILRMDFVATLIVACDFIHERESEKLELFARYHATLLLVHDQVKPPWPGFCFELTGKFCGRRTTCDAGPNVDQLLAIKSRFLQGLNVGRVS